MRRLLSRYPDVRTLELRLASLFSTKTQVNGDVIVLKREANVAATTFPSEIINCSFGKSHELKLFCKYGYASNTGVRSHRHGVTYEAIVYRDVLELLDISVPQFYGAFMDDESNEISLFIEWLDKAVSVKAVSDEHALTLAAAWAGHFHSLTERRIQYDEIPLLKRHDATYYIRWCRRTSKFAGNLHQCFPWLTTLCMRAEHLVEALLKAPLAIIHGEYYPHNILFSEGMIYPVDWESAAIAAGEIDIAALTEGWPSDTIHNCEQAYRDARWPSGQPLYYEETLAAARLYLHFRWLGDRPSWTVDDGNLWRFTQLYALGEQLGWL